MDNSVCKQHHAELYLWWGLRSASHGIFFILIHKRNPQTHTVICFPSLDTSPLLPRLSALYPLLATPCPTFSALHRSLGPAAALFADRLALSHGANQFHPAEFKPLCKQAQKPGTTFFYCCCCSLFFFSLSSCLSLLKWIRAAERPHNSWEQMPLHLLISSPWPDIRSLYRRAL